MQLDVAAYGWLDEAWAESYPEDLPGEWRLDYYANEYRAVVVPRGHWVDSGDEDVMVWIGETHPAFEFFWEVGNEREARRLLDLYHEFVDVPSPGGWLLLPDSTLSRSVEQELSALAPVARCDAEASCSGVLALVDVSEGVNLRQLRERLDQLKAVGATMVLLVVMPSPVAADTLEQLQTLCQLYGG